MRDELKTFQESIGRAELPNTFDELFSPLCDDKSERLHVQETYILDYKESVPLKFTDSYGASIIRLSLAFYNTHGVIVIFGVKDSELTVSGIEHEFNIEGLNRALTDFSDIHVECLYKSYSINLKESPKKISALLIPRRKFVIPAKLIPKIGPYEAGKLWIRDRHEVVEVEARHLPILFSDRATPPSDSQASIRFPVHRSFPSSPATVKKFVNRGNLLHSLWAWFSLGDQPRLYLHGPGGSGKSTLAFEFARSVAESASSIVTNDGANLDYVVFISGKETELNTATARQQKFPIRQFTSSQEQYAQILFHSGMISIIDSESMNLDKLNDLLNDLFSNLSGLIVLDDIDALSRRSVDTGEELLFMKAVLANKRTRILYTIRFSPAHALNSALPVPGLDPTSEFFRFMEVCSAQFGVPQPPAELVHQIQSSTNCLPLLIETVVELKKHSSSYIEALRLFNDRDGDNARRYLYQREYDRLDDNGKSRQILARLHLIEEPIGFTSLVDLFQFSRELVRDAISECSGVFLSTFEESDGQTLYQLTPPSIPFIRSVSEQLYYYENLKARVRHFRFAGTHSTDREAAVIVSMKVLIRQKKFGEIVNLTNEIPARDPILLNPKIQSLLGQAHSELGFDFRERARECFKHAKGLGYKDGLMMRRWFHMEQNSSYGQLEAERICNVMISDMTVQPRLRSEFWSNFASCNYNKSISTSGVNRDKILDFLRKSIVCYLYAIWIGRISEQFDVDLTLSWMERPLQRLVSAMGSDVEHYFLLLESIGEIDHDVDKDAAETILRHLTKSPAPAEERIRKEVKGLCARSSARLRRSIKQRKDAPGINLLIDALETIGSKL